MKNIYSLLILLLILSTQGTAQYFNKAYSPPDLLQFGSSSEKTSLLVNQDQSIVSIHNTKHYLSNTNPQWHDAYVNKVDAAGNVLWSKQLGGPLYDDKLNGITNTDDGGYLLVGSRGKINNATRGWIIKLDNTGNVLWEYILFEQNMDMENRLVIRTSEATETYLVAGLSTQNGDLEVMKITALGQVIWSNKYTNFSTELGFTQADIPTSIVKHPNRDSYVIAGLADRVNHLETDKIFTLGINLDGSIWKNYSQYSLAPIATIERHFDQTAPDIIQGLYPNTFALTFGSRNGQGIDNLEVYDIAVMMLDTDLTPFFTGIYRPELNANDYGVAICADPNGYYGIACNSYRELPSLEGEVLNRTSFMKLNIDGTFDKFVRYNSETDAECSYMAIDLNASAYVLKTDQEVYDLGNIGLIKTDLNGQAPCSEELQVDYYQLPVRPIRFNYIQNPVGISNINFPSTELTSPSVEMHCSEFNTSSSGRSRDDLHQEQTIDLNLNSFKAYPSIIENVGFPLTLEYSSSRDENIEISIFDTQGAQIQKDTHFATTGNNKLLIDSQKFTLGVNTIVAKINGELVHTRVIRIQ